MSTQRSTLYVYDQYLGQCTLSEEKDLQASGLSDLYRFSTESAFSQASGHLDQDATGREIYSGSTSILNDVELRSESLGSSKRVAGSVDHVKRSYRYRTFKLREDLFSQLGDYCYYSTCSKRNAARIDEDVRVVDAILCKKTAGRGEFTSIPTLAMAIAGIEQELQRGFRIEIAIEPSLNFLNVLGLARSIRQVSSFLPSGVIVPAFTIPSETLLFSDLADYTPIMKCTAYAVLGQLAQIDSLYSSVGHSDIKIHQAFRHLIQLTSVVDMEAFPKDGGEILAGASLIDELADKITSRILDILGIPAKKYGYAIT